MIRKLWKHKLFLLFALVMSFLLVDRVIFQSSSPQGEPRVRQILQINEPVPDKSNPVVIVANGQGVQNPPLRPASPNASGPIEKPPVPVVKASPMPPLPSGSPKFSGDFPDEDPSLPGVYTYLPHLKTNPSLLSPAITLSKGKTSVSIVIGIPSIRRSMATYLYDTLKSLFTGMNPAEAADTLIMVCLTEPWNMTYAEEVKQQLQVRFPTEVTQGLLELIVPKAGFYPNLENLPPSLGDKPERIKWRTKQNLDYAFLMMHAWSRGQYYLQLEDDVQATKGFITSIKKAVAKNRGEWVLLEFSTLGFIGRLFHASSVPQMADFLLMFHTQKPCDWLMEDYLQVRMCGHGEKWAKCLYKIRSVARPIRPSLFQHLGFRSSLQGRINKLKDKHYSTVNNGTRTAMPNPPVANIFTNLQTYANDIYDAYMGERIFWATIPKEGDVIEFMYNPPVTLQRIIFRTGDDKHPTDILTNAVVEVLQVSPHSHPAQAAVAASQAPTVKHPVQQKAWHERSNTIPDLRSWAKTAQQCEAAFVQIGKFDGSGQAAISLPPESNIGPLWSLRIRIMATSKAWLIVKQISLTTRVGH